MSLRSSAPPSGGWPGPQPEAGAAPPEGLPPAGSQALRLAERLVADLPCPALLAAGEALSVSPNARFLALAGLPVAGRPLAEVFGESAEWIGGLAARALRGEACRQAAPPLAGLFSNLFARVTLSLTPVREEAGSVCGLILQVEADERADEAAAVLAETAAHYRTLFESMDEGFCVIEFFDGPHGPLSDYIHIEANPAYAVNAGIPNVVGQTLREMVPAEADRWIARYRPVLETGVPVHFEQELVKTGRLLDVSAFRIEPPCRCQVAVLFKDVTDRRRAEAELRRVNETLEARVQAALAERSLLAEIVEKANAFVHVVDRSLCFLALNTAAIREFEGIFGVRPQVGARLDDLLADRPELLARLSKAWGRALAGEDYVTIEEFAASGGGAARFYEEHFNALRDETGAVIAAYLFAYDVTERLAEQERLRLAEEALRQAQKMEAVGQLTGGLAHDFNNLLAGISGTFEMIGIRIAQGRAQEVEKYLAAGQGAARRAAALTHRLLAFARRQTLSPRPINVNKLLGDLVELVQRTVGPAITVETVAAGGLWTTLVDANQLENAIINLCINARDAMPHGGRIIIETENRWLDERMARERNMLRGQYVTISVTDTGAGIEKTILDRVFDPFFTTKPMGEGTGLGLSMVYGFARQSHGHVHLFSEVGQGTTVSIYLPRHLGEAEERDPLEASPTARQSQGGEAVLLVDDEPTVRLLVADALGDLGYACIEAEDAPAALRIFESGARIDLLITDVGLPGGLNGRQLADAARVSRPALPILFITGYAENAVLSHGHIEPGMEVLTKPFGVDDLVRRVERMLQESKAGRAEG
ncbi:PAS domain-containing protein [Acidisoma sp. C75]